MRVRNLYTLYILFTLSLLLPLAGAAQSKTDSLFTLASQQIYDNPDSAIEIVEKLINDADATADIKVRAILIISTAYSSKRDYNQAMDQALSAVQLIPKLKNNNLKINLLNRIGGLYQELQIYEKAIVYLDQALEAINALPEGEIKSRNLGVNNLLRGFIYREQMSCEIALNFFEKGIEDYKKFPNTAGGNANISISYYNRGNCLLKLGKIKEAESSFLQSLDYAEKAGATSAIAFAQKGLAQIYTQQEYYTKAIDLLTEALKNSEMVGDKVLNRSLFDALAKNYLAINDFKKHTFYRNKNNSVHNLITKVERKTVDDSMSDLILLNSERIKEVQNNIKTLQIVFIISIFLSLIFMIRYIIMSEKTIKSLKKRLKF